ncbi:MAG TPA: M24 family metallopeptidase [Spirochaetota bacterium]|nr:M24 family metallopeptidase [Spirochaetota bacterium]HOM38317.1 M24 family metallopeptidase [Spirochaetota bacterium]HPQ48465.1 M24 family metallopeptidase [Spirochaetota bacterium]
MSLEQILKKISKINLPYFTKDTSELKYFLNYNGSNGYLFITNSNPSFIFFTDARYYEEYSNILGKEYVFLLENGVYPVLKEKINTFNFQSIYIDYRLFTYKEYLDLKKNIKPIIIRDVKDNIWKIRKHKSKEELELIKKAVNITEETMIYLLSILKEGVSEKEIAIEAEYYIKIKGGELSFKPIVLFGPRTSYPHGESNFDTKLKNKSVVLIDIGAKYKNYCADMTRTVFFGNELDEDFKKFYNILLDIQKKAIEKIENTLKGCDLDNFVRDLLKDFGLEKFFVHSLGHGVGIDVHEPPLLSYKRKDDIISKNMVFTIEPGIYIPSKYGIRIEDMIYIDDKFKTEILTTFPKELLKIW